MNLSFAFDSKSSDCITQVNPRKNEGKVGSACLCCIKRHAGKVPSIFKSAKEFKSIIFLLAFRDYCIGATKNWTPDRVISKQKLHF